MTSSADADARLVGRLRAGAAGALDAFLAPPLERAAVRGSRLARLLAWTM